VILVASSIALSLEPASQPASRPASAPATQESPALYRNDFEKAEIDTLPDEFLVLEGEFKVREIEGNRVLELPGSPLSTFGLMFGPRESVGVELRARFLTGASRRRFSTFGVGLGGVSGYHLRVSPGKNKLEIVQDEEPIADAEYKWKPDVWTMAAMRIRKSGDKQWVIEGKVWQKGEDEPKEWKIAHTIDQEPPTGQPSIWGIPYASKPILFDDLAVMETKK
jgi:hypothetical protein